MGVAAGGLAWSFYLVVEPVMRRRGPHTMIGWSRLMDGRWSDPLVGRDLLIGCVGGVLFLLASEAANFAAGAEGEPLSYDTWGLLASPLGVVELVLLAVVPVVVVALASFMLMLLLNTVLRNAWVVAATLALALAGLAGIIDGLPLAAAVAATLFTAFALLLHFGLLPFVVAALSGYVTGFFVVTLDFSVWYAPNVISALAVVLGLAGYGFYRSVAWEAEIPSLSEKRA